MENYKIYNDKAIRFIPLIEYGNNFSRAELIITKEEFLACYNAWVLGENYRPNCDGDMRGKEE